MSLVKANDARWLMHRAQFVVLLLYVIAVVVFYLEVSKTSEKLTSTAGKNKKWDRNILRDINPPPEKERKPNDTLLKRSIVANVSVSAESRWLNRASKQRVKSSRKQQRKAGSKNTKRQISMLSTENMVGHEETNKTLMVAPAIEYLCGSTRLGNKLFLLAATISTAVSQNRTFVWLKPHQYCKWVKKLNTLFDNLNRVPSLHRKQIRTWRKIYERNDRDAFKVIPVKEINANIAVGGFRQSWKYFSSPSEQQAVRKLFTFSTYYEEHVRKVFTAVHTTFSSINKPILVGLHMRLGDLLHIKNGKRVADKPFFDNVLKAVKSHFNGSDNLIFVASSDSPNVGKEKLADAKELYNIFWLSGTDLEDFATLSKCNHSITSGGTFGFWTSWLAGGETFYNANVSIAGSSFDKRYISDNFNLPTWIPVSWI